MIRMLKAVTPGVETVCGEHVCVILKVAFRKLETYLILVTIGILVVMYIIYTWFDYRLAITPVYYCKPQHILKKKPAGLHYDVCKNPKYDPKGGNLEYDVDCILHVTRPLIIWTNDYHTGTIADLKAILEPMNVIFLDRSLSGNCHSTKTCAKGLCALNQHNGMDLHPNVQRLFWNIYKSDPEMSWVDAFVCYHPVAMCELFLPFERPLIMVSSTRFELGRFDPNRWRMLIRNLQNIADNKTNLVAANNRYDREYLRYFTGLRVPLLPALSLHPRTVYTGARPGFLLWGSLNHALDDSFLELFSRVARGVRVHKVRELYPHYQYSEVAAHQGIIHIPFQVSTMSIFEQYRMNIPLFFPSVELLTSWQVKYHVVSQRTFAQAFRGIIPSRSAVSGVVRDVPDPNNEQEEPAIRHWLQFADFYSLPHITYFHSHHDLARKLVSADLTAITTGMAEYNRQAIVNITHSWRDVIYRIKLQALRRYH